MKTVQEPSDTVAAGKVIRTLPPAGQTVPKGTEVTMVVSTGAEPVPVPDVEGKTEAEARDELQAAGFLQRVVYQDVPFGSTQDGKVISQAPAPGTPLPKGETVTLDRRQGRGPADDHHDHDHDTTSPPPRRPTSRPLGDFRVTCRRVARRLAGHGGLGAARKLRSRSWPADGEDRLRVELHALDRAAPGGAGP